jgi:predicted Ser/Thr protein kinase
MPEDSTGSPYPEYVWNYAVHADRQEQLFFWRLGFYPSYVSKEVVPAIEEVMRKCGIRSVVLYELYGIHDLLLRVWIPASCSVDRFRNALVEELSKHSLKTCDPFIVNKPVRHWLFPMGQPERPAIEGLTEKKIDSIESRTIHNGDLAVMKRDGLVVRFKDMLPDPMPSVVPIKFAVVVVGEPRLGLRQLQQFERTVAEVLDEAEHIDQPSLYSGFGFGHFLVLGAVQPENFYAIDSELIGALNKAHIQQVFDSRTYTYISGVPAYLRFTEGLSQSRAEAQAPAETTGISPVPNPDRFKNLGKLGEGGFAPVYHVYDTLEKKDRAIKVFASDDQESAQRELWALRLFHDDRVVKVYSIDEEQSTGRSYIVMEYIDGTPLSDYAEGRYPMDDRLAVEVIDNVLDALTVIHPDQTQIDAIKRKAEMSADQLGKLMELEEEALVHRDIKPGNIILRSDRSIKLIDFNISSPAGAAVRTVSGTPSYQAPDATSNVWDVSTDLFATAVVLYELICGAHPYPNAEPRSDRKPIDPRVRRPDLSDAFAEFLIKGCGPSRYERFQTAREMRAAMAKATESL